MIFGKKKEQEVRVKVSEFCSLVGKTVAEFSKMIEEFVVRDKHFKMESRMIHDMEHEADVARRTIEQEICKGAFLPGYRSDYLMLIESIDRIANKAEEAGDNAYLLRPYVPEQYRPDFVKIGALTMQAYEPLPTMVNSLFEGGSDFLESVRIIERLEGEVDKIQFKLIHSIFKEYEAEKVDKLFLKMVIDSLAAVSDRIENVGDQMMLISALRKL